MLHSAHVGPGIMDATLMSYEFVIPNLKNASGIVLLTGRYNGHIENLLGAIPGGSFRIIQR